MAPHDPDRDDLVLGPNPFVGFRKRDVGRELVRAIKLAALQPRITWRAGSHLVDELKKVVKDTSTLAPSPRDKRFAAPEWQSDSRYRKWLQSYLAVQQAADGWVQAQDLPGHSKARLDFMKSLILDALAPSNMPIQPEAVKRFKETGGHSALDGAKALIRDLRQNRGLPAQVDKSQFRIGRNVATTEGAVILRSEVMELIQYRPTTAETRQVPILIVPPQINKYYIFDLSPEKSVVASLLAAGFEVFVTSWKNPTAQQRDWGLDEYCAAIDIGMSTICNLRQVSRINLVGACAGGVTLSSYAAARAAAGDQRINTLTLMVNVLDLSSTADTTLGMFATPRAIEAVKKKSRKKGVLDGKDMSAAFAWLRPNDLIWSYWVNNILLGKAPPAFDVLYWNNDSTRLPAQLHQQFMDLYHTNALTKSGAMRVHGMPVDLKRVSCDKFLLAGTTDHITPWEACYRSTQMFGGNNHFVLCNSGHIQSILSPPGNRRAEFWTAGTTPPEAQDWRQQASHHEGSWWPYWHGWLAERSGPLQAAPQTLGSEDYPVVMPAPGYYVRG